MSDTTPARVILTPDQVDDLGQGLLALTREVWVLTDRVRALEAVLAKHGLPVTEEIEAFEPDEKMSAELLAGGQRLVQSVLGAMGVVPLPGEEMAEQSFDSDET